MEHRARRSAGRAGLRVEPEAIAADNRLCDRPLHRGQRVGGNACCVGEARQIVARQRRGWQEAQREREQEKALEKEKKSRPPRPKNNEKSIAKLEKEISKLEAQSAELDRQSEEFSSDYQKLMDIQQQKDALDEELLALYERWEELNA